MMAKRPMSTGRLESRWYETQPCVSAIPGIRKASTVQDDAPVRRCKAIPKSGKGIARWALAAENVVGDQV